MSLQAQQGSAGGMPVLILKEGASQTKGRDAQKNNITAAKLISEIVRTSLGPRGMDKMLVDSLGDVTITNDGATILKEIDVQHPAAKMMVEISKATDNEVGDGTTSVVVLAGSLIEKAEELITKNVHPTVIVDGYRKCAVKSIELLNNIAIKVTNNEKEKLIKGIVLDKEVVHGGMPKRVEKAKIALINSALEIEKTEFDAKLNITSPEQMKRFLDEENTMLKTMVEKITGSGANIVICQKGLDDIAQHYLAKANVLTVRRVKESDMTKLSRATGARVINNLDDLTSKDLGAADLVEERKVETDKWVFIEGCKNPKAVTILIRGGSQ